MAKQLISSSETKSVYRDGSTAIKEFCEGFPKAEVLNEALCNARVETIEVLNVPKVLGVSVIDGKWSITREFVEGKTLQQLMEENPDKTGEYLEQMVDLHLLIFADMYMDLFCDKRAQKSVMYRAGSPSVAAAQLANKRPEKRNCWKAGLMYLIISKSACTWKKEVPEDIFRRLFPKSSWL